MFNWTVMAITYFRFQRAMRVQNIDKEQYLHTKSRFLPYACYWALFWAPLFLFVQGYAVFLNGHWKITTFIFNYGIVSAPGLEKYIADV
jgi:amino acid transporter